MQRLGHCRPRIYLKSVEEALPPVQLVFFYFFFTCFLLFAKMTQKLHDYSVFLDLKSL